MEASQVYKILKASEMEVFKAELKFNGSEHDLRDGFIHLVDQAKLELVISKYFSEQKTVFILEFNISDLKDNLKWEKASDGDAYPHLYSSPLRFEEIASIREITP